MRSMAMFLLGVLAASPSWGQQPAPSPQDEAPTSGRTSNYPFAAAMVDAISWANIGSEKQEKVANREPKTPDKKLEWMAEIMATAKIADNDYRRAIDAVKPFLASDERIVSVPAQGLTLGLSTVIQTNDGLSSLMAQTYDQGSTTSGDFQKLAEIRARREEAWKLVMTSASGTTFAITMRPERPDEHVSIMRLTKDERRHLKEQLRDLFGPQVTKWKAGETATRTAAALLYKYLSGNLRAMDEKPL